MTDERRAHTIPVAFVVTGGLFTEKQAALLVAAMLRDKHILPEWQGLIDSWRLPNHPEADGSEDTGERLVWASSRRQRVDEEEVRRAVALRAEGKTIRDVAEAMGWSVGATYRRLHR